MFIVRNKVIRMSAFLVTITPGYGDSCTYVCIAHLLQYIDIVLYMNYMLMNARPLCIGTGTSLL